MADKEKVSGKAKGGIVRAQMLTPDQRTQIAKKAAEARWASGTINATHEGILHIGDLELTVAVLEDGTRLLTSAAFLKALGRPWKGTYRNSSTGLPNFIDAKNLAPFIKDELKETLVPIEYRNKNGAKVQGYRADLLPVVCEVYLDARNANVLKSPLQQRVAAQAEMLVRSLSKVGVVALIDEATGYQEVRNKQALQAILDAYLRKELAAWAKRFPDDFYKELFRLKGWPMNPINVRRPGIVGRYTNDIVYARLAPGILEELEKRNPKDERGNRKAKHHQMLTDDVGHPALAQHLYAVIGAMRGFRDWNSFLSFLDRAYPKKNATLELDLGDPYE